MFIIAGELNLCLQCEVSLREVVRLSDLSHGSELSLVLGELKSQSLGSLWLQVQWLSLELVGGLVLFVELCQTCLRFECVLEVFSVLLVDDGQVSGDCLSHELTLGGVLRFAATAIFDSATITSRKIRFFATTFHAMTATAYQSSLQTFGVTLLAPDTRISHVAASK